MFVRMIMIGVLAAAMIGCATTESSEGRAGGAPSSSAGSADSAENVTIADATSSTEVIPPADSASETTPQDRTEADSAGTPGSAPVATPIDPSGFPLEEVMIPRPGIRLVYDVAAGAGAASAVSATAGLDGTLPSEITLVLQPSRTARADISIHAPGAEGYLLMEETDTLWRAGLVVGDRPLTRALSELAYPRFLPTQAHPFRSGTAEFVVTAVAERAWDLVYDSGATVGIRDLVIQPMALDSVGPEWIDVPISAGETARLTLRSAAVYREREISGAVVSAFGRPLSDITVAPHPQVGRLPASRVAVTDAFGAFTLPYRAAPGDSVRLFYGRTAGSGTDARITNPQEIRGRVASPDFATLIFGQP